MACSDDTTVSWFLVPSGSGLFWSLVTVTDMILGLGVLDHVFGFGHLFTCTRSNLELRKLHMDVPLFPPSAFCCIDLSAVLI